MSRDFEYITFFEKYLSLISQGIDKNLLLKEFLNNGFFIPIRFSWDKERKKIQKQPVVKWKDPEKLKEISTILEKIAQNYEKEIFKEGIAINLLNTNSIVIDIDDIESFKKHFGSVEDFLEKTKLDSFLIIKTLTKGYHIYLPKKAVEKIFSLESISGKEPLEKWNLGFELRYGDKLIITYPSTFQVDDKRFEYQVLHIKPENYKKENLEEKTLIAFFKTISEKQEEEKKQIALARETLIYKHKREKELEEKYYDLKEIIQKIKEKVSFEDLIPERLAKKRPDYTTYHCPFHPPDKNPSFSVKIYKDAEIAKDFHNDKAYDVIAFYEEYYNVDFKTALKELARIARIDFEDRPEREKRTKKTESQKEDKKKGKKETDTKIEKEEPELIHLFESFYTDKNKENIYLAQKHGFSKLCRFFEVKQIIKNEQLERVAYILKFSDNAKLRVNIENLERKKFFVLFNKKEAITETQAKYIVDYIINYVNTFPVEEVVVYEKIGWISDEEYRNPIIQDNLIFDDRIARTYQRAGDKEKELELMKFLFKKGSYLALGYVFAFSSVLIYPLNLRDNIILFIQGKTGKGKSTLARISLSTFGNYKALERTLNITDVGFEASLSYRTDSFVLFDEMNTANLRDLKSLSSKVISMIFNTSAGKFRTRSEKSIKEKEPLEFRGTVCFTSEEALEWFLKEDKRKADGVFRRSIVIDLTNFDEEKKETFKAVYSVISENYGNLLKDFIYYVLQNKKEIEQNFYGYYDTITELFPDLSGQERSFALFLTTLDILESFFGIEKDQVNQIIQDIIHETETIFKERTDLTKEKILEELEKFKQENEEGFTGTGKRTLGKWEEEGSFIKIYLTDTGFEAFAGYIKILKKELKKILLKLGICEPGQDRMIKKTRISINSSTYKAYCLIFEKQDDSVIVQSLQEHKEITTFPILIDNF